MAKSHVRQAGFSAIEAVIAVLILGIALLLTMKGTALMEPMRGIITANQLTRYQDLVSVYKAQYRALPGDDVLAAQRWGRPSSMFVTEAMGTVNLAGDGRIQGLLSDEGNAVGEQFHAWRDLRFAGLIDGDKELVGRSAMPDNPFGGTYGFAEDNFGVGQVICATKIPGAAASAIDRRLDDGNVSTGKLRGSTQWDPLNAKNHFSAPDSAAYDPDKAYIICLPFMP